MPVISLDYDDLISLMGLDVPMEDLVDKIPMIGSELERVEGRQIDVNFFPNRPDLYSVEGVSRALKGFFDIELGLRKYDVKRSNVKIIVDESVESIRPFIVCAVIKGLKMTDDLIKSLMDMQEKLHLTIGRKRKKVSIGVHDFSNVKAPFIYKAVEPSSIKFIPLGKHGIRLYS
jgi:phenylalanyl-tRNA synthetase beta chain